MRAASFVNKLEFEMNGSLMKNALALGDVDNDRSNELAVGSVLGELCVYKGTAVKPWMSTNGLGMVTSVLVGNVMNVDKNYLLALSGEGFCYIFDACATIQDDTATTEERRKLRPCHVQQLPSNTKMAILADIDDDGNVELVIGLTDRVVRSYRWTQFPVNSDGTGGGTLVALNKWELANQIGSVSLHTTKDGLACLLVAQPGGTFVRLQCANTEKTASEPPKELMAEMSLDYHLLTSMKLRNPNVTTEILGNVISNQGGRPRHFAVGTLDGLLLLVDSDTEHITWSMQVDHQLFSLNKLDISNDGREEVIVVSWDGQTYIVDCDRQIVRFQFEDSVCSFTAGKYSLMPGGDNIHCLVYATFSNRVLLYYDVHMPHIALSTLTDNVGEEAKLLAAELGFDPTDERQMRELYRYCLYGNVTSDS